MFAKATLKFLDELAANNNRNWFAANKSRYESLVRDPALEFISAMAPALEKFAPHFRADPRKMGGSLMRVFRDTRFSRDKTPYKTNIGIQFRHELGKGNVHAPGFYVHIATDELFLAVGCWRPDSDALGRIRDLIAKDPKKWFSARDHKKFVSEWELTGDSLTRPPRGYAADHPAIDDLKRKDFIGIAPLTLAEATGSGLVRLASTRFAASAPLMSFLCEALEVQY
ncbi:MAG: TIGR02453 family protein [Sterolibacterium sp.]